MHPILIELGGVRVYSYGVLITLGGILSGIFWFSRRGRMGLHKEERLLGLIHAIFIGGFLGGRLLYLVEYVPYDRDFWRAALSLTQGFSVLGAFAGVAGAIYALCRYSRVPYLRVMDYVCQVAPFWHFFGRLGCFMAGCCYGAESAPGLAWAVRFCDPDASVPAELLCVPLHPAQLYEGFADLALAAALFTLVLRRVEAGRLPEGAVCAAYFAGYGALRFALELFRGDTVPFAWGLTAGQAGSLALLAAGIALHLANQRKARAP